MEILLDIVEARILGSLLEKEMATPDYYPLTLNALINACSQKSNRSPVMAVEEEAALESLETLREKKLVRQVITAGSRVPKYEHSLNDAAEFERREAAVLCVLLLRGPQTPGEIRGRTSRMYEFSDLSEVEYTLKMLAEKPEGPFTEKLPLQAGRKENRFIHLFCGRPDPDDPDAAGDTRIIPVAASGSGERIARIEKEVEELREEVADLKRRFDEFVRQFD